MRSISRSLHKLTAAQVRNAKDGTLSDGGNLYLRTRRRSSAWVFRAKILGEVRDIGLGSLKVIPMPDARKIATDMRASIAKGEMPEAPRLKGTCRGNVTAIITGRRTFKEAATDYIEAHKSDWRNEKHHKQWWSTLVNHADRLMNLPVQDITVPEVNATLLPIWSSKAETASRVRQRIQRILSREIALGNRPAPNPAAWDDVLEHVLPKRRKIDSEGYKAVPAAGAQNLFSRIWDRQGTSFAAAGVAIAALTALRSGEIRGLRWDMVDLDAAMLKVPAEMMKADREHRVPLSAPAMALLRNMKLTESDLVFPGKSGNMLSNMSLLAVHRRLGVDYAVHGWRACFRTHMAEAGESSDALEFALAHSLPKLTAAYMRASLYEQRIGVMNRWAEWLSADVYPVRTAGIAAGDARGV